MEGFLDGLRWIADSANWAGPDGIPARSFEHLVYSGTSLALASLLALPIGMLIGHTRRWETLAVQVGNAGRAIPSFAILAIVFLISVNVFPSLAFGFLPTVAALTLLGIPVVLINTYVGIQEVDRDTVEAAKGMGLDGSQILFRLEIPLAMPLIITGLRLAAVQIVATAGLAALIAGGGLGRYVVDGIALNDTPRVVAGAVLIAVLAIATELAFSLLSRAASPRLASQGRRRRPF